MITGKYDQSYLDMGEGETILLLHGLFGNLSNWVTIVEHFRNNYRVIIPRLPIFEGPRSEANLDHLVLALDEFILSHQLDNITLVGNSLPPTLYGIGIIASLIEQRTWIFYLEYIRLFLLIALLSYETQSISFFAGATILFSVILLSLPVRRWYWKIIYNRDLIPSRQSHAS